MSDEKTYFRTGLGLKKAVLPILEGEYHSQVVDRLRERGYSRIMSLAPEVL